MKQRRQGVGRWTGSGIMWGFLLGLSGVLLLMHVVDGGVLEGFEKWGTWLPLIPAMLLALIGGLFGRWMDGRRSD